jgi:catechol 2,3-dioxygenase-like lactoylglutathione lyase family enzyme
MLGAVCRPERQPLVIGVIERSAAADGHQPGIADTAQDHRSGYPRRSVRPAHAWTGEDASSRYHRAVTQRPPDASRHGLRMDNVLIVVEDLDAAIVFFTELGMELEGRAELEGEWVDRVIGIDGARDEIATLRTPDGNSRLELTQFHTPAAVGPNPKDLPVNALGYRRIMFAVNDLDDTLARLRAHGAELVRDVVEYEGVYRLCFIHGPSGIIIGLAQPLTGDDDE